MLQIFRCLFYIHKYDECVPLAQCYILFFYVLYVIHSYFVLRNMKSLLEKPEVLINPKSGRFGEASSYYETPTKLNSLKIYSYKQKQSLESFLGE